MKSSKIISMIKDNHYKDADAALAHAFDNTPDFADFLLDIINSLTFCNISAEAGAILKKWAYTIPQPSIRAMHLLKLRSCMENGFSVLDFYDLSPSLKDIIGNEIQKADSYTEI